MPSRALAGAYLLFASTSGVENSSAVSSSYSLLHAGLEPLLSPKEATAYETVEDVFEKFQIYCHGRWLGVQVLQSPNDLLYIQNALTEVRPDVVIETGTYKGGLTVYIASVLEALKGLESEDWDPMVITIDRNDPSQVFDREWFCPVCQECTKAWQTPLWQRRVHFIQGYSDQVDVLMEVEDMIRSKQGTVQSSGGNITVLITLDASHEAEGVLTELLMYSPLVSTDSYIIVQDARLDRLWKKPAVFAATAAFLQFTPDFHWDRTVPIYGSTQHMYLRRVSSSHLGPLPSSCISASDDGRMKRFQRLLEVRDAFMRSLPWA